MDEALNNRAACTAEIHELTRGDEFMTRYALLYAMECLDLRDVNRLLEACSVTVRQLPQLDTRAKALMQERFGK